MDRANPFGVRVSIVASLLLLLLGSLAACQTVQPLKADAGADKEISVGAVPVFDGCASTSSITNYRWVIVKAPADMADYDGKVIKEIESACSFVLEASMLADEVGEWLIELTVSNKYGESDTDQVMINVVP